MINESGTGRAGVKFSQFIGTVLVASVTAYAGGYAVIPVRRSDTAMITDDKEKSLFVINAKTNDVTIFDAKKLNGRKSLATGNGTFGVFKFDKEKFPNHSDTIYVVSYNKLSYINVDKAEIAQMITYQSLVVMDAENDVLMYHNKNDDLIIVRLSTGEILETFEKNESLHAMVHHIKSGK